MYLPAENRIKICGMKNILSTVLLLLIGCNVFSQPPVENLIIVTTDGLRWQEVFKGMDSVIANQRKYNQGDSAYLFKTYGSNNPEERRKRLMPFFWSFVKQNGQIYGNRDKDSRVNVANPYKFSYPGYSEIFTGYPDTAVNSNEYMPNPHENVLEYINHQLGFNGRVAAFGAWEAFDRILNKKRSSFPIISAFDTVSGTLSSEQRLVNNMLRDSYKPFGESECLDVFTHYAALEYAKTNRPRVLYIAYGETDEWAHEGKYKHYLDATKQFDKWLSDLWTFVQSNPDYRDKTAFLITTDHGRGDLIKDEWTSHGRSIQDADEIWLAVFGKGIPKKGEVSGHPVIYQKQFAQTIAFMLGTEFTSTHPIAGKVEEIFK